MKHTIFVMFILLVANMVLDSYRGVSEVRTASNFILVTVSACAYLTVREIHKLQHNKRFKWTEAHVLVAGQNDEVFLNLLHAAKDTQKNLIFFKNELYLLTPGGIVKILQVINE